MFLIYISGIDGCGKTTQAQLLVKFLKDKGLDAQYAWLRWEATLKTVFDFLRGFVANRVEKHLLSKTDLENLQHIRWVSWKARILSVDLIRWLWWNYACADYYFSSRKPFRQLKSDIVVVDRYLLDFVIDQACNLGVKAEDSEKLRKNLFLRRFRPPDLNIIIDLAALEGYTRKNDGTPMDYLKDRENRYQEIPSSEYTFHVNGLNEIEIIAEEISFYVIRKFRESLP